MTKRVAGLLIALAIVVAFPSAQGKVDFSGTWKLDKTDPPMGQGGGRGGRGGGRGGRGNAEGSGGGGPSSANARSTALEAVPATIVISQSGNDLSFDSTFPDGYVIKLKYKLDFTYTVLPLEPGGDGGETRLNGPRKTRGRWDGEALYLYVSQGIGQRRDILTLSGGVLSILRDTETPGGSGTIKMMYTKAS
jgi:hypothetical protein